MRLMRKPQLLIPQTVHLRVTILVVVGLCVLHVPTYSQGPDDVVLVKGNPPLTQLMVGKVIALLDWALELKLSREKEAGIRQNLIATWQKGDKPDVDGALEIIDLYEKVFPMSEAQRNAIKSKIQEILLQAIRSDPADELSRMLLSAYQASHAISRDAASTNAPALPKTALRVGADGFTGIYRMVRPKAISINSTTPESGYWIEYITFLPNGNVYWRLPPEGLLYFDPAVAQRAFPSDWGTYEIKSGEIHILRGPEKRPYVITRTGDRLNNPPSLGKGSFRPIPSADGLKLSGKYRRSDQEPGISFSTDGRFQDAGIFAGFGTAQRPDGSTYQDDGRGGSGSYIIEQNTLELRYSDGRIRRVPFIAFPENLAKRPELDSFILRYQEHMSRY
jgi:hypothetical protein